MSKKKTMIILLVVGSIKKRSIKMSQYFLKPYDCFGGNFKVELDLPNYETKTDLKGAAWVDTSNLTAKSDSASLKTEVDKIDRKKLKTAP